MQALLMNALGVVGLGATLGGMVALDALKEKAKPVRLHAETLCPEELPVSAHFAVLVDRTDPLTEVQGERLAERVEALRQELPVHGRLSVHLLTADPAESAPAILDLCHPGDASSIDPTWGNPRRAQERFEAGFEKPLTQLLFELRESPTTAPQSPIMLALATLAETMMDGDLPRRVVLVSDLLENTSEFSVYRSGPDLTAALRTTAFTALSDGRLNGVEVQFEIMPSATSSGRQTPELTDMWARLVLDAQAGSHSEMKGVHE